MTDSDDILATGRATQSQLGKLFRRDKASVPRLLAGLPPVGKRKGYDVWDIAEAATMLVKPGYEVEDRLRTMNQADLPPLLGKEFWNGQAARLSFEQKQGDLWPTADVEAVLARAFQGVVMAQKLMLDKVERQASVTPQARDIIKRVSEGTINATKETLLEMFANHPVPNDNVGATVLGDDL